MKDYTYPELVAYLNECRDAYYNEDHPLISDSEYDQLFDLCKKMEKDGDMTEDERKASEKSVQDLTDKYIKEIDAAVSTKQADVMAI